MTSRRHFLQLLSVGTPALMVPGLWMPVRGDRVSRDPYALWTTDAFTSTFGALEEPQRQAAEILFSHSFQEAVADGLFPEEPDLLIPLGLRDGEVDFGRGMRAMWDDKLRRNARRLSRSQRAQIVRLQTKYVEAVEASDLRITLRSFRELQVARGIEVLGAVHAAKRKDYRGRALRFMDDVVEAITPNVLLAYSVQELLPPRFRGKTVTPVAKLWYYDRMLKEAGPAFLAGFPARYDALISFGPFQFTDIAMVEARERNRYAPVAQRIPKQVTGLRTLQQHVNTAVLFAHINWGRMARQLSSDGQLTRFINRYEALPKTDRQLLVAGLTACMHHRPGTARRVASRAAGRLRNRPLHLAVLETLGPQLTKYFISAGEAYLYLKVFHTHDEAFGVR